MTLPPEPDIDYKELDRTETNDLFWSKPHWYKKGEWVVKKREGFICFENWDSAILLSELLKIKEGMKK